MKTLSRIVLGCLMVLGVAGVASADVLPADATNIRDIKIFRNVSGGETTSGTGFVLQDENTDSNVLIGTDFGRESSLGLDVTTTTSDDAITFIGCQLDDTCIDDGLCRVVTYGPAICKWAGADDNTDTRMAAVGTTTIAGNLGNGTNAGLTMSRTLSAISNDTDQVGLQDQEIRWIWVSPSNGD